MKKVLIPTKLDKIAANLLTQHGGYEVVQDETTPLADLAASHADAHALIVRSEKVSADIMELLPQLKVIVRAGAGFNTIDIAHARTRGIDVMNTPGANANAVAEEVVALMLADARHLIPADASCRAGLWEKSKFMGRELSGKRLGVIGLGHIGQLVVKRLSGFEMTVSGFDPVISEDKAERLGVTLMSVEEIFATCDYITLHVPENAHTRGMINKALLDRAKDGVVIINCARSGILEEGDLREARKTKSIRYLNDVYPKDEAGDKTVADVADIMLPHLGASTKEANSNAAKMAAHNLIELDEKGNAAYVVNRDIPLGLDPAYGDLAFTLAKLARGLLGPGAKLKGVEISVYGSLKDYANWMVVPIVCALHPDFNRSLDHKRAEQFLADMGVTYANRPVDDSKRYGNSITIDLTGGDSPSALREISVRGTLAEGNLVLSRINHFDKLYIEPRGHFAIFIFEDRPGVLSAITAAIAAAGINIDDVRNPHDSEGKNSIAVLQVNQALPEELLSSLRKDIQAQTGVCISFE